MIDSLNVVDGTFRPNGPTRLFFGPAHMHHGSDSWMAGTVQQQFARSSRQQSTWFFLVHCCDRQSRFLGWECRITRIVRAVVPGLCTSRPVGCHLSHVGVSCKAGSMDWGCSIGLVVPRLSGNVALKLGTTEITRLQMSLQDTMYLQRQANVN